MFNRIWVFTFVINMDGVGRVCRLKRSTRAWTFWSKGRGKPTTAVLALSRTVQRGAWIFSNSWYNGSRKVI